MKPKSRCFGAPRTGTTTIFLEHSSLFDELSKIARAASLRPLSSDAGGQQPELCTLARGVGRRNPSGQRNPVGGPLLVQSIKGLNGCLMLFPLVSSASKPLILSSDAGGQQPELCTLARAVAIAVWTKDLAWLFIK